MCIHENRVICTYPYIPTIHVLDTLSIHTYNTCVYSIIQVIQYPYIAMLCTTNHNTNYSHTYPTSIIHTFNHITHNSILIPHPTIPIYLSTTIFTSHIYVTYHNYHPMYHYTANPQLPLSIQPHDWPSTHSTITLTVPTSTTH